MNGTGHMNEPGQPQNSQGYPYAAGHPLPENPYYPPSGTYPAPYEQPIYNQGPPPEAEPPKKTRRVGTITMGVCLVAVGIILILAIFLPAMDVLMIARFAPLVLVLLGAEILIAHIRHRDEKLRYDILSVIICILLIGCSLFAAAVPVFYQRGVETQRAQRRLSTELRDKSYAALEDLKDTEFWTLDWYVSLQEEEDAKNLTLDKLDTYQDIHMNLYMDSDFASAEDFAKACYDAAGKLKDVAPHVTSAFFDSGGRSYYYVGDKRFTLGIDGRQLFDLDAEALLPRIHTEYWIEGENYYVSEWEYEDRMAHPENYGYAPDDADDWTDDDMDPVDLLSVNPADGSMLKNGLTAAA